jgi:hypothetical protein
MELARDSQAKKPSVQGKRDVHSQSRPDSSGPVQSSFLLQNQIGNASLQQLLRSGYIQAKGTLDIPADSYEQEADTVAEQVMRKPVCTGGANNCQDDTLKVQTKPLNTPFTTQQRCPQCEAEASANSVTPIQFKSLGTVSQHPVPSSIHRSIRSPGSGSPLNGSVRSRVEPILGADLSNVRVHSGTSAQEASHSLNAKAFTHQNNIFLGKGQSATDLQLMAHESTHVVQQGAAGNQHVNRGITIQRLGLHDPMTPPAPIFTVRPTSSYTVAERLEEIDDINSNDWIGPLNEARLEVLWGSFGSSLPAMLRNSDNMARWNLSVAGGAELEDIPYVRRLIDTHFKSDVKSLARNYMSVNEEEIRIELEQINARGEVGEQPTAYLSPVDQDVRDQIEELQRMGELAQDAMAAERALRSITLGTKTSYGTDEFGVSESQTWNANFDPQEAPSSGYTFGLGHVSYSPLADAPSWEEVKAQWDVVKASQAQLYTDYPAIAALVEEETLGSFISGDTNNARETLARSLVRVLVNIERSRTALESDDLDYRDLKPLHQQLLSGAQSNSGTNWNDPLPNWALQKEMENHETSEFWIELGLGTLAAAAFIVAEIATFGGATFFIALGTGLAIGGGMALSKWENYEDLSTANQANVLPGTSLVSDAGVRAALINAALESVFFFLDALGPAIRGIRVARTARMGSEATGEVLEIEARMAAREAGEEVAQQAEGRALREVSEEVEREAAEQAAARAGRGAFTRLDEARIWARDAFVLSADILNNLSLAAINRLRGLSAELIQRFRSLTLTLKRLALGCASPCRCDLPALRRFLEDRATLTTANHTPITTVDELIDALPAGIDSTLIRDKLQRQPFLMTMIREAGITVDDMSALAIREGGVTGFGRSAQSAKTSFSTFLTSLIPAKIGPNRNRFLEIIEATRRAELAAGGAGRVTSSFQGPMFENYSRLYVSAFRNRSFGRIVYNRTLIPALEKATRESDVFVPRLRELWDMKFARTVEPDQVRDYARILAHEAGQVSPRVTSINFLFANRELALANRHLLSNAGFNIYYLSRTGRRLRLR